MEIINNNYNPAGGPTSSNGRPSGPDNQARNLFFGTLLVAAGFLWLLRDFHVVPYWLFNTIFSWQMLLAVTGAYLLDRGMDHAGRRPLPGHPRPDGDPCLICKNHFSVGPYFRRSSYHIKYQ